MHSDVTVTAQINGVQRQTPFLVDTTDPLYDILLYTRRRERMREKRNVSAQCLNYEGKHLLWLGMGLSILVLVPSVGLFRDRQT